VPISEVLSFGFFTIASGDMAGQIRVKVGFCCTHFLNSHSVTILLLAGIEICSHL